MSSYTPFLIAFWIVFAACLTGMQLKYNGLNKKFGSKLVPAGHPFGWVALVVMGAYYLLSIANVQAENVLSALSNIAVFTFLGLALKDTLKTKKQLANAPALIAHEGIPEWGTALKGLNEIYIDLSGIDTKTLVESKIDVAELQTMAANKLQTAGISVASTKASAKCWLTIQMKTQSGPKQTGSITTIYMQIGETYTNDRLDAICVRVNAPIFSTVTVAVCDGTPSAEALSASFEEKLDQFVQERNS